MASKKSITHVEFILKAGILIAVLASFFFNPIPALADGNTSTALPDFDGFVLSVQDGQANVLRGVYVPGDFAFPVIQQPVGSPGFVSKAENQVTQFEMAAEVGNVGLLAHNFLAGTSFSKLTPGQEVRLVYGDGRVEYFTVSHVLRYQALEPYSTTSEFRDLETNISITAEELFRQVYRGDRHVTFQTCIESNGNSSWGRLFIVAEPGQIAHETYAYHLGNLVTQVN